MLRLLRSEIYRLRRRWMPQVLLFVIALSGFLLYALVYLSVNAQLEAVRAGTIPPPPGGTEAMTEVLNGLRPDKVQGFGLEVVLGLGSVMLVVLAASHTGAEYGWGTLRTLLAHGAGRGAFLAAKLASLVLFALLFTAVGTIAVVAASYAVSAIAGLSTTGVDLPGIVSRAARGLYTMLPYMALAALIALLAKSGGAGIAAGLVIFFGEALASGLVASLNPDLAKIVDYGLSRNVEAVQQAGVVPPSAAAQAAAAAAPLPDARTAALVLAAYTAAFVALAYWRLRSRDVTLS